MENTTKKALISGPNVTLTLHNLGPWESKEVRDMCVERLIDDICDFVGDDPNEYTYTEYEE